MTGKERVTYIYDYYKFPILVVIAVLIAAGSLIHHYATYRAPVMNLVMVNSDVTETAPITQSFDDFLLENGFDPDKKSVGINASLYLDLNDNSTYQSQETLQMLIATHSYSGFFSDSEVFDAYAADTVFIDLEEYLSEETLEKYADDLLYATDPDSGRAYICGIHLTPENNAWLSSTGAYETCSFGVLFSDCDDTLIRNFLDYIL
jgi:hypothetical protein